MFERAYEQFGNEGGEAVIRFIIQELGGLRVRVPDFDALYRKDRDRRIREEFTGSNHAELAIRWGIKKRQVRRIVQNG